MVPLEASEIRRLNDWDIHSRVVSLGSLPLLIVQTGGTRIGSQEKNFHATLFPFFRSGLLIDALSRH